MALEVELKFLDPDLDRVRARLEELGGRSLGRVFERNTVFDDPARSLRAGRVLLRLRRAGQAVLTLKHPPVGPQPGDVKVFEEIETRVADPGAMETILAGLGYAPTFVYEKVREEWTFADCHVCLDRLPFGDFVEIEGEREALFACAAALGLDPGRTSTANYHALHLAWRRDQGLAEEESFVFPEPRRQELLSLCQERD